MNKLVLCFFAAFLSLTASAQKIYFIYLQSEAEQPFFVSLNGKVHSSSASGYLILAKLQDSTYTFKVGFPQNKWPEQKYTVAINRKDHGYLLKNFGEKGWGLFDLQTLQVQMAAGDNAKAGASSGGDSKDVSAFTEILSRAASDPSLKERPIQPAAEEKKEVVAVQEVVKKEEPVKTEEPVAVSAKPVEPQVPVAAEKKEEPKAETKVEPVITVSTKPEPATQIVTEIKEEPKPVAEPPVVSEEVKVQVTEEYKASTVKKRSESSTTEGFGLVFIDSYANGENDTIRLLIPNPKPVVASVKEDPKEEKKMLDIPVEVIKPEEKSTEVKPVVADVPPVSSPVAKSNCKETAVEADFFRLRKAMAAAESDDEMINVARREYKAKCYTTSQLKNLGSLFLTDEGKYKFYDASYSHVADAENFGSLETELKDEYYVNRFKAMLRH